jgi:hypothetical protein
MANKKKGTYAKQNLTMAEAHARISELKPRPRVEGKSGSKAVPAGGVTKPAGRRGER